MKQSKTPIEKINTQIDDLVSGRQAELQKYSDIINQANARIKTASADMQNAIESEDPQQYKIAKDRIGEAQALIDIYNVKIEQTRSRSLVSGDETLQTRRSIKAFEMKRAEAFTAQVDALINQIEEILNEYDQDIKAAERVLSRWCNEIQHFDNEPYYGSHHAKKIGDVIHNYRNWEKYTPVGKVG